MTSSPNDFHLEAEEIDTAPKVDVSLGISSLPLVVAYGGGLNSTAMLCGFKERGIKPDLILFADTGGEMPETYVHTLRMKVIASDWWPDTPFQVVKKEYAGGFEGLEGECIRGHKLPALAYGRKACSQKYKTQPQTKRLKEWMAANEVQHVRRAIGYDAKESHRALHIEREDLKRGRTATNWFPLIEWQWGRDECAEAIERVGGSIGLKPPGKSACFFCPAMKRGEILRLKAEHPDLFMRALAIEANAILKSPGRGLGGQSLRWENVDSNDNAQDELWDYLDDNDESPIPCGCYDG
jgi:hypothetical protein